VPLRSTGVSLGSGENGTYELNVTSWTPEAAQMSITVMVVDSYGRILDEDTVEAVARAAGWNVGIFSFTADEELKVSIQRTSYDILEGVNCRVEINTVDNSLDEPLVRVIDIAEGDFPPVVIIPAPTDLADNKQLRATLACDVPYDVDDDLSDNEATALYTKAQQPIVESSEIVISIVVASLLLVVAYLAGMMGTKPKTDSKPKPLPTSTELSETESETTPLEEVAEEEDEFSFELAEEPASQSVVTEDIQQVDTVEVIDLPDEEDVTPSGRLASLRDEMTENQPSAEGREDRMRRFFGNQ
jgi:flagellar basal body-associated protein FliL